MKQLKGFQEEVRKKLHKQSIEYLAEEVDSPLIIFQSPTGSGKTFTMAKYIESLTEWSNREDVQMEIVFLWVSIGKGGLEEQSYESLNESIDGEIKIYKLAEIQNADYLSGGDVVVFNWEKVRSKDKHGNWKNIAMREGERGNFVQCLEWTRKNETKIVLIIDECHTSASTQKANELRKQVINADLTIEVSATPILKDYEYRVKVKPEDPIDEGMIKKEIIINSDLDTTDPDGNTETVFLESAHSKLGELKKAFKSEGKSINPLCLIQIPNSDAGDEKKKSVESFLAKKGITTGNGKLAIHLTEEKINEERSVLAEPDNEVEYLIFKQAIDTGWDCPRAHILIKFRETKSIRFQLQTVGRILRMPEQEHYKSEILNTAYVYTNDDKYEIVKEEYNPNIIKVLKCERKGIYEDIKLKSWYQHRTDFGDIEADFYEMSLEEIFCRELGKDQEEARKKGIDLSARISEQNVMLDMKIEAEKLDSLVNLVSANTDEDSAEIKRAESDLENAYRYLLIENLEGFAKVRSLPSMREAIRTWFREQLKIEPKDGGLIHMQSICLNNYEKFSSALNKVVRDYEGKKSEKNRREAKKAGKYEDWEVPKYFHCNTNNHKEYSEFLKHVYSKPWLKFDSDLEDRFVTYLDRRDGVKWWWMNGSEHKQENFGIPYMDEGKPRTFQPDYIVQFKDGKIGIFDTKATNDRNEDTKLKAEALQRYIKEQKRDDLFGGIIIGVDRTPPFLLNSKPEYRKYESYKEDWEPLDF